MKTLVEEWMYSGKTIAELSEEFGYSYKRTRDMITAACEQGLRTYIPKIERCDIDDEFKPITRLSFQEQIIFDRNVKQSFKNLYLSDGREETVGTSR